MPRAGGVLRRVAEAGQAELSAPVKSFADYMVRSFGAMLAQQRASTSLAASATASVGSVNVFAAPGGGRSEDEELRTFARRFRRMLQANAEDAATLLDSRVQSVARRTL